MTSGTKIIGVIGGLGPAATLDFFGRIISKTKALRDQDHLRVINSPLGHHRTGSERVLFGWLKDHSQPTTQSQ